MDKKLWYNTAASVWEEALPVGNGRIGAMIYGGAMHDRIAINEETLWTGNPQIIQKEHDLAELDPIRRMLQEQKYAEANQAVHDLMQGETSQAYVPYGDIHIETLFSGGTEGNIPHISEYRRELDLDYGIVSERFRYNGALVRKEYFVSAEDQTLIFHMQCEKRIAVQISQALSLMCSISDHADVCKITGRCPTNAQLHYGEEESVHFCSLLKVITPVEDQSRVHYSGSTVVLSGVNDITLLFAIRTSFAGFDKMPVSQGNKYKELCLRDLKYAESMSYETLRERHITKYRSFFDRVALDLQGEDYSYLPTDQRIRRAGTGKPDNGLVVLVFDYARYLAICGSREGTQPMNLQGIWNHRIIAPWSCNYTLNINTQMNYWIMETCDLPELHEPLLKMIKELSVKGNNFSLSGWCVWHNTDLWRFNCEATKEPMWGFWPMGSAWCCRHIWEHYLHTRDKKFLDEYYPVMAAACDFYCDWMWSAFNEKLVTGPSVSPENQYSIQDFRGSVCIMSAMDTELLQDLFEKTIYAGELLKKDTKKYRAILARLPQVLLDEDGKILEWSVPLEEAEPGHRHISHLYGFFPSDIWADGSMDDAVLKTIKHRVENGCGGTGWSNAWLANVYARLGDGETVMEHIRRFFRFSCYPNLMDAHPPFQIDGNFGICRAICEALLQSHTGEAVFLPAVPDEWGSGSVRGFVTQQGEKVSFFWDRKNGRNCNISIL